MLTEITLPCPARADPCQAGQGAHREAGSAGPVSDPSRSDAASTVSMSDRSSGSATPSLNRPPLNQATVSKPDPPARGHHLEEFPGELWELLRSAQFLEDLARAEFAE